MLAALQRLFGPPLSLGAFGLVVAPGALLLRLLLPLAAGCVLYRVLLALLQRALVRRQARDETARRLFRYLRAVLRGGLLVLLALLVHGLFGVGATRRRPIANRPPRRAAIETSVPAPPPVGRCRPARQYVVLRCDG